MKLAIYICICILMLGFQSCKKETTDLVLAKDSLEQRPVLWKHKNIQETELKHVEFPSKDGLMITADIYKIKGKPISILLCHQAGYSRGEYKNSARILNTLGYSVMAIDQRSGKSANEVENKTAKAAKLKGMPTGYLDARQDIEAAIDYVYANNGEHAILLVGSSYSASLSLLIAVSNPKIKAVVAFSPGEYFKGININNLLKGFNKSVFVTSSKSETPKLEILVNKINTKYLTHHKPTLKGIHGSRALWESTPGTEAYWEAFKGFLIANNSQ